MNYKLYFIFIAILFAFIGCEDDNDEFANPVADFEFEVTEGSGTVKFINKSTGADVYAWEFGDSESSVSTDENPVFEYTTPGSYDVLVKLYAGDGNTGVNNNISKTISLVDVPATIKIENDGDIADWEYVPYVEEANGTGEFNRIKVWGEDKDFIHLYIEGTEYIDLSQPVLFIDVDNNPETGYTNLEWYSFIKGADLYVDGNYKWYANFTGADGSNDWSWAWAENKNGWLTVSEKVKVDEQTYAYEFSINKEQLKNNAQVDMASTGIAIGVANKSDERIPENGDPIFVAFE